MPQKQDDVKLLHCIKEDELSGGSSSAKASNSGSAKTTSGKTTTQARAPTEPIIKQVKAAEASKEVKAPVIKKTSWLVQVAKVFIGLASIFLIILIIKIKRQPQVKVIGGHFGEDET